MKPAHSYFFFGIDGDQPVPRLPFLVGEFTLRHLQELPVVFRRLLEGLEIIVRGGAEEIRAGRFRQKFRARVQGADGQLVLLVLRRGQGQIAIRLPQVGLQLHRLDQRLLRGREIARVQQRTPQGVVQFGISRLPGDQRLVPLRGFAVVIGGEVERRQLPLRLEIVGIELEHGLVLGARIRGIAAGRKDASQLQVRRLVLGIELEIAPQHLLHFRQALGLGVDVHQPGHPLGRFGIELDRLLVLAFGVGKAILLLEEYAGGEVRLHDRRAPAWRPRDRRPPLPADPCSPARAPTTARRAHGPARENRWASARWRRADTSPPPDFPLHPAECRGSGSPRTGPVWRRPPCDRPAMASASRRVAVYT